MTIWQFQRHISHRLMRWALFSVTVGLIMRRGGAFWRNMGGQFASWGIINAMISLGGRIAAQNRIAQMENPGLPEIREHEQRNLGRLLWINAGLDILYMLFGWRMARRDEGNGVRKGNGWGIIIQGAFLFVFDVWHALNLPEKRDKQ